MAKENKEEKRFEQSPEEFELTFIPKAKLERMRKREQEQRTKEDGEGDNKEEG